MTSLSKIIMAAAATALGFAGTAFAQQKEVMIGAQCDRTGPTQIVGVVICPAQQDYMSLINSKGGIECYKINYNELDNEYKVPPAVEEYQRQKGEGAARSRVPNAQRDEGERAALSSRRAAAVLVISRESSASGPATSSPRSRCMRSRIASRIGLPSESTRCVCSVIGMVTPASCAAR